MRTFLAIVPLALAAAGCVKGEVTGAQLDAIRIEAPSAEDCGSCHHEQYKEWKESLHAAAFVNPRFVAATNDRAFTDCMGCHVPQTVYTEAAPAPRAYHQREGVTCSACHMKEGKLTGPVARTGLVAPHETGENDPLYRKSDLCGKCHEGTLREWTASALPEKKHCQECHMGEVTRKMTASKDFISGIIVSFEKEVKQRRHGFSIEETKALDPPPVDVAPVEIRRAGNGYDVTVRVENKIPHTIPTGDFGYREAILIVTLRDEGGVRASFEHHLFNETKTAIPAGGSALFQGRLEGEGTEIEIVLVRAGKEGERKIEIVRKVEKIR